MKTSVNVSAGLDILWMNGIFSIKDVRAAGGKKLYFPCTFW